MIIKKFDINSVSDFLGSFIEHTYNESNGDVRIVCLVRGGKANEMCLIHSNEKTAVEMLLTALDQLNNKKIPPEIAKAFDSFIEDLNKM